MKIVFNGKEETFPDGISLKALLELKGVNPNVVACELNMNIVKRANLATTMVNDKDQLEVIQMIGGG